ncbi:DUF4270 domain-containing protein [Flavobacteriaceae bacterium F08102]|nr:DUF4270 domain-containing protein [Flavobacteriaceae bacterium F08102]
MLTKMISSLKYTVFLVCCLGLIIACEKDFDNVGVELLDNQLFKAKDTSFNVISYNKNIERNRVDGVPEYLLGVYNDPNFGLLKASFYAQLSKATLTNFGNDVSIDAVILNIPYYATLQEDNEDGTPNFKLDSIIGDQSVTFNVSIHELTTYLNLFDPADPSKRKQYFSDETYNKGALLYSDMIKPNKNDTVLYVERRFIDDDRNTIDDIDTIAVETKAPSLKFSLDTTFFRNKFVNAPAGVFDSNDDFIEYFRGLAIEVDGTDGALMSLPMSEATVSIYYTNTVYVDESTTDLNGDGDMDDLDVPVRTKQVMSFPLTGIKANTYVRDYSTSMVNLADRFANPNTTDGEDRLFIQGAAGSNGVLELFGGIDFDAIRSEGWLINEASLTLYVDPTSNTNVPEKLYLYNEEYNSQIVDVFTGFNGIGGTLVRDAEDDNKPIKYEFSITDYFSKLVNSNSTVTPQKFGLKVYHSPDDPVSALDTIVRNYSWTPKPVVLKGNNRAITDTERLQLKVYYTKRD